MEFKVKSIGLAPLMVVLAACSATPKQDAPASQAAVPAATAPAPATASAAPTGVNTSLLGRGYRPQNYKGHTVYCRSEKVTGTNFPHRVCLSEAQIAEQDRAAKEAGDSMSRPRTGPACQGQNCGG